MFVSYLLTPVDSFYFAAELEKKFRNNEQRLQKQRIELEELKGNATFVRDEIRDQVQKYSDCA